MVMEEQENIFESTEPSLEKQEEKIQEVDVPETELKEKQEVSGDPNELDDVSQDHQVALSLAQGQTSEGNAEDELKEDGDEDACENRAAD